MIISKVTISVNTKQKFSVIRLDEVAGRSMISSSYAMQSPSVEEIMHVKRMLIRKGNIRYCCNGNPY
jgi:hypothetical protein